MKVLVKKAYKDLELKRTVLADEKIEVTEERAKVLLEKGLIWGDEPKKEEPKETVKKEEKAEKKAQPKKTTKKTTKKAK